MGQQSNKKHEDTQKEHWQNFLQELDRLKDKQYGLDITYNEIANGLGISRQRLSQFVHKPELGLPIDRASILKLWDYLTEPEELDKKEITSTARKNREKLRIEASDTLDKLLKSAGFLPSSRTIDTVNPQIERVKYRLSSFWIANPHALSHITDSIINTILDHGGFTKSGQKQSDEGYPANKLGEWLRNYVRNPDPDTVSGFEKEINRFENSGKMRFCDEELFELYQSILENNILKDFDIRMRVTDCQFKTVSFSLIDDFENSETKDKVSRLSIQGERNLRALTQRNIGVELNEEDSLRFSPVIQATVSVNFENKEKSKILAFSYISSTTHVGNMLVALSNGLGYVSSVLEMTSFFVRAIGRKRESLARISITLTDNSNQSYHGLWIEQNTIVGVLQAFSFAVMLWLSERLSGDGIELFYDICHKLSHVNDNLYEAINDVYNHSFNYGRNSEETIENQLSEKVIKVTENLSKQIERMSKNSMLDSPIAQDISRGYFENCNANLVRKGLLARLALAHAALVQSKSEDANRYLNSIKDDLYDYTSGIQGDVSQDFTPILILYESESMFFKLLSGERDFIERKEWRNSFTSTLDLEEVFEKLREYVNKRNFGILDIDVYLAVSQFSGICGLIDFYTCDKRDVEYLKKASDTLILSACYSARIGQRYRAARALCHSIRACCRLSSSEEKTVSDLIKAVEKILSEDSPRKHSASAAQFELARGEALLRFKSEKDSWCRALSYFLSAWYNSNQREDNRNPFIRTKADSFYDIYRVLKKLRENNFYTTDLVKSLRSDLDALDIETNGSSGKILTNFMASLQLNEAQTTYDLLEEKLKENAIAIWNSWSLDRVHPFAERIRKDTFLENCE